MKKTIQLLTLTATTLGGAAAANAGWTHTEPVTIGDDDRLEGYARASVAGTAAQPNDIEYFHCETTEGFASCYFRDAEFQAASCWTVESDHLAAIKTVGAASFVEVEWRSSGFGNRCTYVRVRNGSAYAI